MMNTRYLTMVAMALGMFAVNAEAEPGITDDAIHLGGTNSGTGTMAAACSPVFEGAMAWLKKVNDNGGVHGREVKYTVLEDNYSAQRAIGNARRLVEQDQVFGLFSGCGTATTAGVLSYLEGHPDVPLFFPYAGLQEMIRPPKENVFALMPLYDQQLAAILPYAISQTEGLKTAAILSINIAGADQWRQATRDALSAHGIELVYDELMEATSPERAPFVAQITAKNPDLLIVADSAPGAARIFLELKRQNWKPRLATGISTMSAEQFLGPIGDAADGILIVPGIVVPPTDESAMACNEALAAEYPDTTPSHFSVFGCLQAIVLVEALERAGADLTRSKLIEALETMNGFDVGISAPITFGPDRRLGLDSLVPFGVRDGQFYVMPEQTVPLNE